MRHRFMKPMQKYIFFLRWQSDDPPDGLVSVPLIASVAALQDFGPDFPFSDDF